MSIYGDLLTYPTLCLACAPPPPSLLPGSQHAGALFHFKIFLNPDLHLLLSISTPSPCGCDVNFAPRIFSFPDGTPSLPLARHVVARAYPKSTP